MSTAAILRPVPFGKRLHPIALADAQALEASGHARQVARNLYEQRQANPPTPEPAPDADDGAVYAIKVMAPKARNKAERPTP